MSIVHAPRLRRLRRHPVVSVLASLALLAGLGAAGAWAYPRVFRSARSCGPGLVLASGRHPACVGVDLGFAPFTTTGPARARDQMRKLEDQIKAIDAAAVSHSRGRGSRSYLSVLLLLDLSPEAGADTITYPALYPNIEGAITAVWRADKTLSLGPGVPIKLYLANMGSDYRSWRAAVGQIKANAVARHITSVIGLGQSTTRTRKAAAMISSDLHIPVIGSTVTGDSMNTDPATGKQISDFFRVSPPNSAEVAAAAQYLSGYRPAPSSIAIVKDTVSGDDYTRTLAQQARQKLTAPGRAVRTFRYSSADGQQPGTGRFRNLESQFYLLDDNLCPYRPSWVYFAGRGQDLGAFVYAWDQNSYCNGQRLAVLSGDDASAIIKQPLILHNIRTGRVTLSFTVLASPDMWLGKGCGVRSGRENYLKFLAAFTGDVKYATDRKTKLLAFPRADLDSGQAMLTYDAMAAAIYAVRPHGASRAPLGSGAGTLQELHGRNILAGSGGEVAFGADGNPVGMPVPIVQLKGTGSVSTIRLTWPDGHPYAGQAVPGGKSASGC